MFNWKKLFKKRIDPKDIPVLEDVINDFTDERKNQSKETEDYPHLFSKEPESTIENDEFVIDLNEDTNNDENNEDEDNVVILSSVIGQTDIDDVGIDEVDIDEIDDTEIGAAEIDNSDTNDADIDSNEANIIDIDDSRDETETNTDDEPTKEIATEVNEAETDLTDSHDCDTDHNEIPDNHLDLNDPDQLEIIVNKVVEQLKPEIELQLHSFVEKALTETSPEDFLKSLKLDNDPSSDKS